MQDLVESGSRLQQAHQVQKRTTRKMTGSTLNLVLQERAAERARVVKTIQRTDPKAEAVARRSGRGRMSSPQGKAAKGNAQVQWVLREVWN